MGCCLNGGVPMRLVGFMLPKLSVSSEFPVVLERVWNPVQELN